LLISFLSWFFISDKECSFLKLTPIRGRYRREQIGALGGEVSKVELVGAEGRRRRDLVVDGDSLVDLDHHGVVHPDDPDEVSVAVV
jgi:hypothetical protein